MNRSILRAIAPAVAALAFAGCGPSPDSTPTANATANKDPEKASGDPAVATLSPQQIADAGIEVTRPTVGGVTGVVLAKLDGTAKGGIVVAIRHECGLPIRYVGLGEKADDLQPFQAVPFVHALLPEADEEEGAEAQGDD